MMGSSYLYSYAIFGEIIAFILGWNLIIESLILTALAAQTLSNHLDILAGGRLLVWMKHDLGVFPWDSDASPEIVAAGIILILAAAAVCRSKNVNYKIYCFITPNTETVFSLGDTDNTLLFLCASYVGDNGCNVFIHVPRQSC